jgi:serine/threonine protein phosphatase 1
MKRVFVIGDIHGAFKALQQLMQKIDPQNEDRFIFLGDYVDGWSQSAEIIEWLIHFEKTHECIFLKGNHDEDCRQWFLTGEVRDSWLAHGGGATIESYTRFSRDTQQKHLEFFNRMQDFFINENNCLFVHAGFSNRRGPLYEPYSSNFSWDRTLWETALALDTTIEKDSVFYPKRLLLFNEIYIGHTPTTGYNSDVPMHVANVWNIDTGAAFYGKLSAINIETKEFIQTDPAYLLYPQEQGRNSLS